MISLIKREKCKTFCYYQEQDIRQQDSETKKEREKTNFIF